MEPAPQAPAAVQAPAPAQSAPAPTVAPRPQAASQQPSPSGEAISGFDLNRVQASLVQQKRIIIRTVDIDLVVSEVARAMDEVAAVARQFDGWMVSSNRDSTHEGTVSIRVPAQSLDEAVLGVRDVGIDVVSESSSSKDVTDEYVDSQSRLTSLRATEQSLLTLFERADEIDRALEVQNELAKVQVEIESLLGRIRLMEETAAFSLINVSVRLAPVSMPVNVEADRTVSAGEPEQYSARFRPPLGIDEFTFTWDFGDHSEPVSGTGYAPTTVAGELVTATVNHTYANDLDSPYIVQLQILGFGPAGLAEGSATFTTVVKRIPTIEVFAGSDRTVEQGQTAEYTASFTRSVDLSNFQYRWDFGDGTAPVIGVPDPGEARTTVTHAFDNHRPQAYPVTFTVTADSDAGEVSGSASFSVKVEESEGLVIAGWSAGKNFKSASRALSAILQVLATTLIWVVTLSPIWGIVAVVIWFVWRWENRRNAGNRNRARLVAQQQAAAEIASAQDDVDSPDAPAASDEQDRQG